MLPEFLIVFVALLFACSQQQTNDTASQKQAVVEKDSAVNSFKNHYAKYNPKLNYSFDTLLKIHDYTNNWDLDNDSIKDQVYFIGTGGAHLCYFLKVVLSTDNKPRAFTFLESDFPVLTDTVNHLSYGFAVTGLGNSKTPSILVRLNHESFNANKTFLLKHSLITKNIAVCFENGQTKYTSL